MKTQQKSVTLAWAGSVSGRTGTELRKDHFITKGSLEAQPLSLTVPGGILVMLEVGNLHPGFRGGQSHPDGPSTLLRCPEGWGSPAVSSQHWFWHDPTRPSCPGVPQLMAAPNPAHPTAPQGPPCVPSCPVPPAQQDAQFLAGLNWCRHQPWAFTCSQPRWFCITLQ